MVKNHMGEVPRHLKKFGVAEPGVDDRSIAEVKEAGDAYFDAQGFELGQQVYLPGPQGHWLSGGIVGLGRGRERRADKTYADIQLRGRNQPVPKVEVGQLKEIQTDHDVVSEAWARLTVGSIAPRTLDELREKLQLLNDDLKKYKTDAAAGNHPRSYKVVEEIVVDVSGEQYVVEVQRSGGGYQLELVPKK